MLKVLELFGGIGAIRKAFERLNIQYRVEDYVEIDKYAVASYNAMFNEHFKPQDIKNWDKDIDIDFIMHGSPCQDFSVAGKQAGGDFGSGTRSSLMYETIRIVDKLRPKYVMWENVKNLLSKKHIHNFNSYIEAMDELGYNSYYKVLNAKDYGIPQNRERVYTVSIRKDIDKGTFKFPEPIELKLRLKDMLESVVDEKYYLKESSIKNLQRNFGSKAKEINQDGICDTLQAAMGTGGGNVPVLRIGGMYGQTTRWGLYDDNGVAPTLVAAMGEGGGYVPMVERIGGIFDTEKSQHQAGSIYNKDGIAPTLDSMQGGYRQPMVITAAMRGRYNNNGKILQRLEVRKDNNTNAITTVQKDNLIVEAPRIRKLTPKECWRLMGFDDEDFERAEKVNSNTQLYKQAGNSIVVNVLEEILRRI